MRRGEIWVGNLNPNRGKEVRKIRPVLILQSDFLLGQDEPTVIVLPLTTRVRPAKEPLHVTIQPRDRLRSVCQVMPEQPRRRGGPPPVWGAAARSLRAVMGL